MRIILSWIIILIGLTFLFAGCRGKESERVSELESQLRELQFQHQVLRDRYRLLLQENNDLKKTLGINVGFETNRKQDITEKSQDQRTPRSIYEHVFGQEQK